MNKKIIVAVCLAVLPDSLLAADIQLSAHDFAERIEKKGAEKVIAAIPPVNGAEYDYIMRQIASGDQDWLALVPSVATTGAEGWNESLGTALAQAIPYNADGVMSVIDDYNIAISTSVVCSMPLYRETIPEQNSYFVKAVQSLYKSKSAQAQKCLQYLVTTVGQSGPFRQGN